MSELKYEIFEIALKSLIKREKNGFLELSIFKTIILVAPLIAIALLDAPLTLPLPLAEERGRVDVGG